MNDHAVLVEAGKIKVRLGADQTQILTILKGAGLPIIDAIKAVKEIYQIPLQEAKKLCALRGLWNDQVEAAKPLHDDLERLYSH